MPEVASAGLQKLHVTTDELNGKQVTFDYSQEDVSSLITSEQLTGSPIKSTANGYSIVGAEITTEGTPGNVLIDGAPALEVGVNHWRFVGVSSGEGDYGCGISSTTGYGSGWGLNAFYLTFNGNLAGRGCLKSGFVANMPKLPVVDWVLEVSEDNVVDAYLFVNGQFEGHAGHLQFPDAESIKALRPVISFNDSSKQCKVVFISHNVMPIDPAASYKQLPQPASIYDCKWKLIESDIAPAEFEIILTMMSNGVSVKVGNNMHIGATVGADGSIKVNGPVASTRMMVLEPLQAAEKAMSSMLESLTGWTLAENMLMLMSDNGSYKWTIHREGPVTENPLAGESKGMGFRKL